MIADQPVIEDKMKKTDIHSGNFAESLARRPYPLLFEGIYAPLPPTPLPLSVVIDKFGNEVSENSTLFIQGLQPGRHVDAF